MPKPLAVSLLFVAAISIASAQNYTVIHHFGSKTGDPSAPPVSPGAIAQSRGGALFTTTVSSEAFRIWPGGDVQLLHKFGVNPLGDNDPVTSGLTLATDGKFWGATQQGGANSVGTIFRMTQDGHVTSIYTFDGQSDAGYPTPAPIQSIEGDFYGVSGPGNDYAAAYRLSKEGNFTLLHGFDASVDGREPIGPLVQGKDYYFYGTMYAGGPSDAGTIFKVNSKGDFKLLVQFDHANGGGPTSGLIQANDGNFYGVTFNGGPNDSGTLFRMTPEGTLTVLHTFTDGIEGAWPASGLVQATDGYL